jgi:hypothetical protein
MKAQIFEKYLFKNLYLNRNSDKILLKYKKEVQQFY